MPEICHIINGADAAAQLAAAMELHDALKGTVLVLQDDLSMGPIKKAEGEHFSELRNAFWQSLAETGKPPAAVTDMEQLLDLSRKMFHDPELHAWLWMAPTARDVTAYFWALPYLSKHLGRFHVISITNLPFLDAEGKLYYPKNFGAVLPREMVKARKLARPVTPSEAETDIDEWQRLVSENGGIREFGGGKKIISFPDDHYDHLILSACTAQYQKAGKLVQLLTGKHNLQLPEPFIASRIRVLCHASLLEGKGDTGRVKELDIRLPQQS